MKKTVGIIAAIIAAALLIGVIVLCVTLANREEDPNPNRQRVTMVIKDQFGKEWCELTEEENRKTIYIPADGKARQFIAYAKFPDGNVTVLQAENTIWTSYLSYTPVGGEIIYNPSSTEVFDLGTYEILFVTSEDNTQMYPYDGYLTIIVTNEAVETAG